MNRLNWTSDPTEMHWTSDHGDYRITTYATYRNAMVIASGIRLTCHGVGVGRYESVPDAMREAEQDYTAILEAKQDAA